MPEETAVLEAPNPGATADTPRAEDWAKGLAAAAEAQKSGKPLQPAQKATETQKQGAPKQEAKTEAKPSQTPPDAKKGGLDALKAKGAPEQKAEAPKQEPAKPEKEDTSQKRWEALKQAEARLQQIEPEHAQFQQRLADYEKKLAAYEKDQAELSDLRRQRDFNDVTKTPKYIEDVETPFNEIQDRAEQVASYTEVDLRALMSAMKEPNRLLRADKVKELLESGKKEVNAAIVSGLVEDGEKMKGIFAKMEKYHAEATEQKTQWESQRKAEKLKAETEAGEVQKRAHEEIRSIFKQRVGDVFTDEDLAEAHDAAQSARTDPMDNAYRGQAEFLFPKAIQRIRDQEDEIAKLKEDLAAATQAKPGIKPTKDATTTTGNQFGSLQEAVAAHREAGGHLRN